MEDWISIIIFLAYILCYFYFSIKVFNRVGYNWSLALLLFIPIINFVFIVMLFIAVIKILNLYGRTWIWCLLLLIPIANIIFLGMIAFEKWPYEDKLTPTEGITWIKKIKH